MQQKINILKRIVPCFRCCSMSYWMNSLTMIYLAHLNSSESNSTKLLITKCWFYKILHEMAIVALKKMPNFYYFSWTSTAGNQFFSSVCTCYFLCYKSKSSTFEKSAMTFSSARTYYFPWNKSKNVFFLLLSSRILPCFYMDGSLLLYPTTLNNRTIIIMRFSPRINGRSAQLNSGRAAKL